MALNFQKVGRTVEGCGLSVQSSKVLRMKKGVGWWLLAGVIGAGLVLVFILDRPEDDPMLVGVVTKTNSISGKELVMGVTNRTNAEFWLVVIPEAMIDREWKPMVSQKTPAGSGLP